MEDEEVDEIENEDRRGRDCKNNGGNAYGWSN
jgi:hypothetical protein